MNPLTVGDVALLVIAVAVVVAIFHGWGIAVP